MAIPCLKHKSILNFQQNIQKAWAKLPLFFWKYFLQKKLKKNENQRNETKKK